MSTWSWSAFEIQESVALSATPARGYFEGYRRISSRQKWLYTADRTDLTLIHTGAPHQATLNVPFAVADEECSSQWQSTRIDGIISSAIEAETIGLEMLKIEFPGDVSTPSGQDAAAEACRVLDSSVSTPWVILSAGVGYDDFCVQLEIACTAGASGYMAGRSVWSDAVTTGNSAIVQTRIRALNEIVRKHGRPLASTIPLTETLAAMPRDWYLPVHR